jgi:phage shock protein C
MEFASQRGIVDGMTQTTQTLSRSRTDRVIAGVCAGLAERFGWRPGVVRLLFVLSCLLPGPQFLVYLVLWAIIPNEDR